MNDIKADVSLFPLQENDREQFIKDNQWAFRYGAQIEFGMRDDRTEEGKDVISRKTIEDSIDRENGQAYRIVVDGQKVGGVVLSIDKEAEKGELERYKTAGDNTTTRQNKLPCVNCCDG